MIDSGAITGHSNSDDFGFKDTAISANSFSATMKGINVDIIVGEGDSTSYFK